MIRQTILRSTIPSIKASASRVTPSLSLAAIRFASTTHAPTNVSEPPAPAIQQKFGPGEEIDPQLNGYPQLPYVHFGQKPALGWWDNQSRTNFGETVHEEDDILNQWGPDYQKTTGPQAAFGILTALGIMGLIAYGLSYTVPPLKAVRREFPFNGLEKEMGGQAVRAIEYDDEE